MPIGVCGILYPFNGFEQSPQALHLCLEGAAWILKPKPFISTVEAVMNADSALCLDRVDLLLNSRLKGLGVWIEFVNGR